MFKFKKITSNKTKSPHHCTLKQKETQSYMNHLPKGMSKMKLLLTQVKLVSPRNPMTKFYFRSTYSIDMERKRHILTKNLHIIHPFSIFSVYWSHWMLMVFTISLIIIPINLVLFVLGEKNKQNTFHVYSGICTFIDFSCLTDIFLTFYTGYGDEDTKQVVLNQNMIARNYMFSIYFPLDLVSSMPTDIFQIILANLKSVRVLELFSVVKIVRARTVFQRIGQIGEILNMNHFVMRIIRYSLSTFLIIHWIACLSFIVPSLYLIFTNDPEIDRIKDNGFDIYIEHIMEATELFLNIHEHNPVLHNTIDFILTINTTIIGKVFMGIISVLVYEMILYKLSTQTKYSQIINQLQHYMRHKQLPLHIQKKLLLYYEYRFEKAYFRESRITNMLPEIILRQINLYSFRKLLGSVTILRILPPNVINKVITKLKTEIFLPNDIIIKAGSTADCMYFLGTGTCCVLTPSGREVCHLESGSYFGEMALMKKDLKRTADVIAIEICEVFRLDVKTFKECLLSDENISKKLESTGETRSEQTRVIEEMHQKFIMTKLTKPVEIFSTTKLLAVAPQKVIQKSRH